MVTKITVTWIPITPRATEGHFVIFDPAEKKSWDEKIFTKTEVVGKDTIIVWGM